MSMKKILLLLVVCILMFSSVGVQCHPAAPASAPPPVINPCTYGEGSRYNIQGWIYVAIAGDAYERGYQHGYLLASEIVDMVNRWSYMIHHYPHIERISSRFSDERFHRLSERWWDFCVQRCYKMYWHLIPTEYQHEIQGIADGVGARGGSVHGRPVGFKDILAINEMYEFMSKLTKIPKGIHPLRTFFHQLEQDYPEFSKLSIHSLLDWLSTQDPAHHCNGFIATGNATTNGQLVFTHSTICGGGMWWWTYFISLRWNVLLDIQPTNGNRVIMSTSPGLIWSDEDYYQNDNGIVLLETTLPQGLYDNKGLPLSVRARNALQYGNSIDDVLHHLLKRNDGSMNAVWLIGDSKTAEIARFELGYRASAVWRTKNGFYWSANNPYDLGVRLEKFSLKKYIERIAWKLMGISGYGYFSPRYHPEPRDLKYEELGTTYYGRIDVDVVKQITMTSPISDWITDIKLTDSQLLSQNGIWLFWGNPWKPLNISQFDTRNQSVEDVPPCGWVQLFARPQKKNFSLKTNYYQNQNTTNVVWTTRVGNQTNDFFIQSTISDTIVYAATSERMLVALNATDGTLLWKAAIGGKPTQPAVTQQYILVGCSDGVYAFNLQGKKQWFFSCSQVSVQPSVYRDCVYVGTTSGLLYCLSLAEGVSQWNLSFPGAVYLARVNQTTLYLTAQTSCYAVNSTNRAILWRFNTTGILTTAPCVHAGLVFLGSWDTFMYCLDRGTGSLIWTNEAGFGFATNPVADTTHVFYASADNNLYALDQKTGTVAWRVTANAAFHGQPVVYGGFVVAGCDDGRVYAVNCSTGVLVWSYRAGKTIDHGSVKNYRTTPVCSNMVAADRTVIYGILGSVVALDAKTPIPESNPPNPPVPPDENDNQQPDEPPHEDTEHQQDTTHTSDAGAGSPALIFVVCTAVVCTALVLIRGLLIYQRKRKRA